MKMSASKRIGQTQFFEIPKTFATILSTTLVGRNLGRYQPNIHLFGNGYRNFGDSLVIAL